MVGGGGVTHPLPPLQYASEKERKGKKLLPVSKVAKEQGTNTLPSNTIGKYLLKILMLSMFRTTLSINYLE